MSKYTHEQLTAMAKSVQYRKNIDPTGYAIFIQTMVITTRLTPVEIEKRIQLIAESNFEDNV